MRYLLFFYLLLLPQCLFSYYLPQPCCSQIKGAGWWGEGEYILLWRKGRYYPPMVTTNDHGIPSLDDPGTKILFGGDRIWTTPKASGRGDGGVWLTRCLGVGGGAFFSGQDKIKFAFSGDENGMPIFGQPFFDVVGGIQYAFVLSFPGQLFNGSIDIEAVNRAWSGDLYTRWRFLSGSCCTFDLLCGFLYTQLVDKLDIHTQTSPMSILGVDKVKVEDYFGCTNDFYSGLAGFEATWSSRSWAINVTGKVGIGSMHKKAEIRGHEESFFPGGLTSSSDIGFFAEPSNIGTYTISTFSLLSSISAQLRLRFCGHFWLTAGYTYMFWPSVLLAGKILDLNVNVDQEPVVPPDPAPILSPVFRDHETSFWMQGYTFGIYCCF